MDFNTRYARPISAPAEAVDSKSKTETAGYIPADVQILRLIEAGKRLDAYRKEAYDFGPDEEVPDDFIDPTRSGSFDLADASIARRAMRPKDVGKKEEGVDKVPEKNKGSDESPGQPPVLDKD